MTRPATANGKAGKAAWGPWLLWAFLLSPLLLWISGGSALTVWDPLFLANAGISLLWVAALHFAFARPAVLHLWLAPLYVATIVDLCLLIAFDARLTSGYIGLLFTDHAEAPELWASYWRVIVPVALLAALVFGSGLWMSRRLVYTPKPRLALAAASMLLAGYGGYVAFQVSRQVEPKIALMELAQKENSAPVGAVWQLALAAEVFRDGAGRRERRSDHRYGARLIGGTSTPDLIVVVVGESSRPQNWSMFGYGRETTPRLKARRGVIGLPNLLTTSPITSFAVPSMFSLEGIDHWDRIESRASVLKAFAEAGYVTHWYSVQAADSLAGVIPIMAAEANHRRYFDHKHDAALLPALSSLISQIEAGSRQLVVLHTKGSHFEYSRRYPRDFSVFDRPDPTRRERLVDTYDNSVLYTDWFLDRVLDVIEKSRRSAVLLYASDHGQNLLDDDRQYFGHALGTAYDLSAAGFLWFSEAFARQQPGRVETARLHASAPLSLSDLPHSLLDVAGVTAAGRNLRRSIFDPSFVPAAPRRYLVRGHVFDEPSSTRGETSAIVESRDGWTSK